MGLSAVQTAFVWIVATAGPVAAVVTLWRCAVRSGAALLLGTMAAAAAFDAYYHAIGRTPDHVHAVTGPWSNEFLLTAVLVSATDLLGVLVGAWLVGASLDGDLIEHR